MLCEFQHKSWRDHGYLFCPFCGIGIARRHQEPRSEQAVDSDSSKGTIVDPELIEPPWRPIKTPPTLRAAEKEGR